MNGLERLEEIVRDAQSPIASGALMQLKADCLRYERIAEQAQKERTEERNYHHLRHEQLLQATNRERDSWRESAKAQNNEASLHALKLVTRLRDAERKRRIDAEAFAEDMRINITRERSNRHIDLVDFTKAVLKALEENGEGSDESPFQKAKTEPYPNEENEDE